MAQECANLAAVQNNNTSLRAALRNCDATINNLTQNWENWHQQMQQQINAAVTAAVANLQLSGGGGRRQRGERNQGQARATPQAPQPPPSVPGHGQQHTVPPIPPLRGAIPQLPLQRPPQFASPAMMTFNLTAFGPYAQQQKQQQQQHQ